MNGAENQREPASFKSLVPQSGEILKPREMLSPESGLTAQLEGLHLLDFLQLLHFSRRSGVVYLNASERGEIHLESGEIVHAVFGELTGHASIGPMLSAVDGHLSLGPSIPAPSTIEIPFQSLMLGVLRLQDERNRSASEDVGLKQALASTKPSCPADEDPESAPVSSAGLDALCRELLKTSDQAYCCVLFVHSSSVMRGSAFDESFPQKDPLIASAMALLHQTLRNEDAPEDTVARPGCEMQVVCSRGVYLLRSLSDGRHALLLVTSRKTSVGMGRALLSSAVTIAERALALETDALD